MKVNKSIGFLPAWLTGYRKKDLSGDLYAGLTVGIMLIPQGLAYAILAGLPPVYGLYAATIPQLVYALFGTSRQLAVGPVAMDSLLVAAGVSILAVAGTSEYIVLVILLSFLIGLIQLSFGLLRLGFIVNFLSKPVISGFTSAAAIIIGIDQLKNVTNIDLDGHTSGLRLLLRLFDYIQEIHWLSVCVALAGFVIIKMLKRIHQRIPGSLVVVILSIVIVRYAHLDALGLQIIGVIPEGLPSFSIPEFSLEKVEQLLPMAFTVALIAFMEAIAIAKALQTNHRNDYQINNNREMISLGLSNLIGSFFSAYPVTGGFSRSAVNDKAGANTNLASIISALLVGLTLLFLTPLFYYLPIAILGAIILVAVIGLVDYQYPVFLWKANKQDFFMLLITFLVTLMFGIKEGIAAGVITSLLMMIYRTTNPQIVTLGRLSESSDYRNITRFEDVEQRDDILIIRYDAQLYFANTDHFISQVKKRIDNKGNKLQLLILHMASVSNIDSTALQALRELIEELNKRGIGVYFSGLIGPVRDFLHRTDFVNEVGMDHFFIDIQPAVDYLDNGARKRNKQMLRRALQTNVFKEEDI